MWLLSQWLGAQSLGRVLQDQQCDIMQCIHLPTLATSPELSPQHYMNPMLQGPHVVSTSPGLKRWDLADPFEPLQSLPMGPPQTRNSEQPRCLPSSCIRRSAKVCACTPPVYVSVWTTPGLAYGACTGDGEAAEPPGIVLHAQLCSLPLAARGRQRQLLQLRPRLRLLLLCRGAASTRQHQRGVLLVQVNTG